MLQHSWSRIVQEEFAPDFGRLVMHLLEYSRTRTGPFGPGGQQSLIYVGIFLEVSERAFHSNQASP